MHHLLIFIFTLLISSQTLIAQSEVNVSQKAITASTGNDVDDCAIWVHPTDPSKSLVIVNDKGPSLPDVSGLYVYTLNGKLIQKTMVHNPQNPDIRYNVVFGKDTMDVLVCTDREANNSTYNKIRVFRIDPSKAETSSGFLTEITASTGIPTGQDESYGHSLYLRPGDGALFSIVSSYSRDDFMQIRLESDGTGKVKGSIVRTWGGSDIKGDFCEGICCDDELGFIYICDENTQVLKYQADPDKKINTVAGTFAKDDGIKSDREGINIYRCDGNSGYILISSQGNDQIKVYDRVTNAFVGTVIPEGMRDCDGLDVTAMPLGPQFPHGMAAFHLGSTVGAQFGFYDWSDIADGLQLATPCDAKRPAGSVKVNAKKQQKSLKPVDQNTLSIHYFNNKILLKNVPLESGSINVSIFDLQGKQCMFKQTCFLYNNEASVLLPVKKMQKGVYIVKCDNDIAICISQMFTIH